MKGTEHSESRKSKEREENREHREQLRADGRRGERRRFLGLGLFALYALGLVLGIFFGDRVVWKFHLNQYIREPLPILMYHHVVQDGEPCNDMTVTIGRLREDFAFLRDAGYTAILPADLLSGETMPEKPVLLTFDDGYVSNYTLLYPLLRETGMKAAIASIVYLADLEDEGFCTYDMYREMTASGLVEVGSHSYALHNLEIQGMYNEDGPNGIQRLPGETDAAFKTRVLDDIQKSHDRLAQELDYDPVFFAYPFGAREPDAQSLIDELFPVSVITWPGTADLYNGASRMVRWTVDMETHLSDFIHQPHGDKETTGDKEFGT